MVRLSEYGEEREIHEEECLAFTVSTSITLCHHNHHYQYQPWYRCGGSRRSDRIPTVQ